MDIYQLEKSYQDWQQWFHKALKSLRLRGAFPLKFISNKALAISGIRRCGKTSAALWISKDFSNALYFNFEDPAIYLNANLRCFDELLVIHERATGQAADLVIFDEIQNIEGWEKWARKAVDTGLFKLVVTGSSAKMLSSEISTSLRGRVIEKTLWPLSFKEYLDFSASSKSKILAQLESYMQWGQFPEVAMLTSNADRKTLIKQYLSDILLKDIVDRYSIRNKRNLDQVLYYYLNNISSQHSYNRIKKAFHIGLDTVKEYTSYFKQVFLLFEVERFHFNFKVQSRDYKKVYVSETGLRNVHTLSPSHDFGKLAENIVFMELKRRGEDVYYFKETQEVDFVTIDNGRIKEAIQVCYSDLKDPGVRQREIAALNAHKRVSKEAQGGTSLAFK